TGLAPFVELHYNTPLNDGGGVRAGNFVVGTLDNRYDEVNLTLGVAALMADNLLLSAGFVSPLPHGFDRFFAYQGGLRVDSLFVPVGPPPTCAPVLSGGRAAAPATPTMPGEPPAPTTDPLTRAPETGTLGAESFNPNFFGDQLGGSQTQRRPVVTTATVSPHPRRAPILPRYVGLKMSDHDSPRPRERA